MPRSVVRGKGGLSKQVTESNRGNDRAYYMACRVIRLITALTVRLQENHLARMITFTVAGFGRQPQGGLVGPQA